MIESFYSLDPVEQKRPSVEQIATIKERDKYCTFPVIKNDTLEGLWVTLPSRLGDAHHIHTVKHLTNTQPDVDLNHPCNMITLEKSIHQTIHKNSRSPLNWDDKYDEFLSNFAIINSFDYLMTRGVLPYFPRKYEYDIMELYNNIDDDFVDRYRFFKSRYQHFGKR